MKRRRTHGLFLASVFAALFTAAPAVATPNFPGAIQSRLGAATAPQCSLCHLCGATGFGTVNTPWGAAMRARGLEAYDESSLAAALAAMERDNVDSDGDGTIDVMEVKAGDDPNPPSCGTDGFEDPTVPVYGCIGQVAPTRGSRAGLLGLSFIVAALVAHRRRRGGQLTAVLAVAVVGASLLACRSGASLAPRAELVGSERRTTPPRMAPIAPSRLGPELARLGLDPAHLPPFEALEPRQLRGVMGTFTRSLGLACTDCHEASDHRAPTPMKRVTVRMWNEMMRAYRFADGGALYCDSCHQGQAHMLDRSDHETVSVYMAENFLERLAPIALKEEIVCENCHGDPVDPHFLEKWRRPR